MVRPQERGSRPDVVLISIDALRADQLGAYGSELGLSPNIDRMASQSVLFEEARASRAETWVSLSAIGWASRPEHIGVGTRGLLPQRGLRSVAGAFADAGYLTARIGQFDVPPGQLGPFDIEENATPDPVIEERVAQLLETRRSQPLFLWVHFAVTHYPYNPSADF